MSTTTDSTLALVISLDFASCICANARLRISRRAALGLRRRPHSAVASGGFRWIRFVTSAVGRCECVAVRTTVATGAGDCAVFAVRGQEDGTRRPGAGCHVFIPIELFTRTNPSCFRSLAITLLKNFRFRCVHRSVIAWRRLKKPTSSASSSRFTKMSPTR
jgi:hypothetical protein